MTKKYQELAAQMYQVVGAMCPSSETDDLFDWDEYERIMDYLLHITQGEGDVDEDILPFNPWLPSGEKSSNE